MLALASTAAALVRPAAPCRAAAAGSRAAPQIGATHRRSQQARRSAAPLRAVAEASTSNGASATVPEPVVKIDNEHDPFATIVTVEYGDRLGELLDTAAALKALGLNIRRAKIREATLGGEGRHKFYITDARTSEKVLRSSKIEEIRLTIINCLLEFHPESGEQLAWGPGSSRVSIRDRDAAPLGVRRRGINTQVEVREHDSGIYSTLVVSTEDRPGLLTDIVHVLKDINLNVVSAEVDTMGRTAFDKFNLTYQGAPLSEPMQQLAVNALQYYLSQAEVEKDWQESY